MVAERLRTAAAERGHEIRVEVQGAMGTQEELSSAEIGAADAVILAADTAVSRDRFEDKSVADVGVRDAVTDVDGVLDRATHESESTRGDERLTAERLTGEWESGSNERPVADRESSPNDSKPDVLTRLKRRFS